MIANAWVGRLTLGICAAFATINAFAQTQFASYTQGSSANTPFRYINTGSTSKLGLYDSSGAPISIGANFQFQTLNSYGTAPGQNIAATMMMTAEANGQAVNAGGTVYHAIKNVNISFTAINPVDGLSNLLTVFMSTALLQGPAGGSTLALQATENGSPGSNTVNYASDFLDFNPPGGFSNKNFAIGFANVQPVVFIETNGYLRNFVASSDGNFGSNPLPPPKNRVPEPMTLALVGLGALVGVVIRRRK